MKTTPERELRTATVDVTPDLEAGTFEFYPVVWDEWSLDLGGFIESFEPRAFGDDPQNTFDVRAVKNHDPNYVMGRTRAGTLILENDEKGLKATVYPPQAQWVDELRESVQRGDISGASFRFYVETPHVDDQWGKREDGLMTRRVKRALIDDVSIVTYPAYPQTSVAVRAIVNDAISRAEDSSDEGGLEDQEPNFTGAGYDQHRELLERL